MLYGFAARYPKPDDEGLRKLLSCRQIDERCVCASRERLNRPRVIWRSRLLTHCAQLDAGGATFFGLAHDQ